MSEVFTSHEAERSLTSRAMSCTSEAELWVPMTRSWFSPQVEAMLAGDISFLARALLFRAIDLRRMSVGYNVEGGAEEDSELGLDPASVEALFHDCEVFW